MIIELFTIGSILLSYTILNVFLILSFQIMQNGGGSGFGLYIAKAVVTLHDGIIWAESDGEGEGKGAVFCVRLPLSKVNKLIYTMKLIL